MNQELYSPLGIHVGATKESIEATRAGIKEILEANVDEATKVVALHTLHTLCKVENVTISDNRFEVGTTKPPIDKKVV